MFETEKLIRIPHKPILVDETDIEFSIYSHEHTQWNLVLFLIVYMFPKNMLLKLHVYISSIWHLFVPVYIF